MLVLFATVLMLLAYAGGFAAVHLDMFEVTLPGIDDDATARRKKDEARKKAEKDRAEKDKEGIKDKDKGDKDKDGTPKDKDKGEKDKDGTPKDKDKGQSKGDPTDLPTRDEAAEKTLADERSKKVQALKAAEQKLVESLAENAGQLADTLAIASLATERFERFDRLVFAPDGQLLATVN